jgi:hypothetical protein
MEPPPDRLAKEEKAIQDARQWFETTSEWERLRTYAEERFEEIHERNTNLWGQAEVLHQHAIAEINQITSDYSVHRVTEEEIFYQNKLIADATRGQLPRLGDPVHWRLTAQVNEWRKEMKRLWDEQSKIDVFQLEKEKNPGWVDEKHVQVGCSEFGAIQRYKKIPDVCYRDFSSPRRTRAMRRERRMLEGAGGPIVVGV